MMKNPQRILLVLTALLFTHDPGFLYAESKIKIVTTTSTFAALAAEAAGGRAEIYHVASPNQNIHFISPTPKDVLKLKKADVFIHGGLDLEIWRGPLLDAAGKKEFITGERSIDASAGIRLMEIPHEISRAHGDIHVFGNPHYWMDPENAKIIADTIAGELGKFYPGEAALFKENVQSFKQKLDKKITGWRERLSPYKGEAMVTYHNTWPYFFKYFGFEAAGFLEPKPGIPPTAKHLAELIQIMKDKNVKVIIREPFQESQSAKKIAKETGAHALMLSQSGDYLSMMENNIAALENAFKGASHD